MKFMNPYRRLLQPMDEPTQRWNQNGFCDKLQSPNLINCDEFVCDVLNVELNLLLSASQASTQPFLVVIF